MAESQTYSGGCQCGAVRFQAKLSLDAPVTCNCSRCQRLGSVFVFVPRADFVLEQGDGAMTEYLFNKYAIRHQFCATCGIESFAYGAMPDGAQIVAVNVNVLDGVDPREVAKQAKHYDGKSA